MYFAIIIFIDDYFSKFLLIFPYFLGVLKVVWDIKTQKSRQKQAEKIMRLTEKIGAIVFFLIVIIRWISTFIFKNNKNFSLIAVLSPLFIVAALVFYTEYQWERISFLKKMLTNQEKYREESGISINDWYGSKSKEYREVKNS